MYCFYLTVDGVFTSASTISPPIQGDSEYKYFSGGFAIKPWFANKIFTVNIKRTDVIQTVKTIKSK